MDNLYIILIDLSTAALPHLNRLMADRSFNLLLDVIFHTWLLHGRQIADDPIINTFDTACTVGTSTLKVSYCGKQYGLLLARKGGVPETQAPEQVLGLRFPAEFLHESPCLSVLTETVRVQPISHPGHHLLTVPASCLSLCVRVPSRPLTGQAGGGTPKVPVN